MSGDPGRSSRSQRRRSIRPGVEALDGRVLMAAQVVPDTNFGIGNGQVVVDLANISRGTVIPNQIRNAALMADGRIVVVGQARGLQGDYLVARFLPDGSLDPSFGPNRLGAIAIDLGRNETATSVLIQPDGKIVLGGISGGLSDVNANFIVTRLNSDGSFDPTFGSNGTTQTYFLNQSAGINALAFTPDFKILAVGFSGGGPNANDQNFAIARYSQDGRIDTSFGDNGLVQYDFLNRSDIANAVVVQGDGRFTIAGSSRSPGGVTGTDVALARFLPNGQPDLTFGVNGQVISLLTTFDDVATGIAFQQDGRIVIGGYISGATGLPNSGRQLISARYDTRGNLDTTFGNQDNRVGPVGVALGPPGQSNAIKVQAAGRILNAGQLFTNPFGFTPLLTRFNENGQPDPTFTTLNRQGQPLVATGSIVTDFQTFSNADFFTQALLPGNGAILGVAQVVLKNNQLNPNNVAIGFARYVSKTKGMTPGDFDGDGLSDVSALLPAFNAQVYRPSGGGTDVGTTIGTRGQSVPAPGDYDGDGKSDFAVYNPVTAVYTIRPSSGGPDRVGAFGVGNDSAVAPGDFDGDGKTDLAVYIRSRSIFAYRPSSGGPDVLQQFGSSNQCLPAVGDYDGDGKSDIAVIFPAPSVIAYRPSRGGPDVLTQFGPAGLSRATPGDYDGDGKTDLSVFIPSTAVYAYRPSSGGRDVLVQFGIAGGSTPTPGDYDGDGKTDLSVYLGGPAVYAYRPSSAPTSGDILEPFGTSNFTTRPTLEPNPTLAGNGNGNRLPSLTASSVADPVSAPTTPTIVKKRKRY